MQMPPFSPCSLTCPVKPNVKVFLTLNLAVISLMNGNVWQTSGYSDKKKNKRFNGRKRKRDLMAGLMVLFICDQLYCLQIFRKKSLLDVKYEMSISIQIRQTHPGERITQEHKTVHHRIFTKRLSSVLASISALFYSQQQREKRDVFFPKYSVSI